jgi:hypothetical protein
MSYYFGNTCSFGSIIAFSVLCTVYSAIQRSQYIKKSVSTQVPHNADFCVFDSKPKAVPIVNIYNSFLYLLFPYNFLVVNPFISITPSKPLISSGSWLTLQNCDIYYLSAVKYDPATTDLIFIRVNIYPGPGEGNLQLTSEPIYFIRVTIYP